jgi:DNA-binding response OmpR family regulator
MPPYHTDAGQEIVPEQSANCAQREADMTVGSDVTIVMVDDNADEIFLTRRLVRRDGIVNDFISENKPERLFDTLSDLNAMGVSPERTVLLLDVSMPRVDGFETLRKLRASDRFRDMPVIMLSASEDEADKATAMSLGASGYMVKPFKADELFGALHDVEQVKHRLVTPH